MRISHYTLRRNKRTVRTQLTLAVHYGCEYQYGLGWKEGNPPGVYSMPLWADDGEGTDYREPTVEEVRAWLVEREAK